MTTRPYDHPELQRLRTDVSYHTTPAYRIQVDTMAKMMESMTEALRQEGFDGAFAERIMSRALYGDPNGAKIRAEAAAAEKRHNGDVDV